MTTRIYLRLAELLVPVLLAIILFTAWQADRRDRAQLASQLAVAQQTIAEAVARQKDRDAALNQTLSQIAQLKQSVLTPAQILNALPQALALPAPITLQPDQPSAPATVGARFIVPPTEPTPPTSPDGHNTQHVVAPQPPDLPNNPSPKIITPPNVLLPSADLKPLYDFALDCRACQAKLAAAQNDLADEKTKSAALTRERDAAVRAAKGGSALRRIARATKWFVLGAAAGALASKASH